MKNEKLYYFSKTKHAHDIEFYHNRLWLTARAMEDGEIPMDKDRYNRINDMLYGELNELRQAVSYTGDAYVALLTGKQIALAKKLVVWASETRANTCIEHGRPDLVQYC